MDKNNHLLLRCLVFFTITTAVNAAPGAGEHAYLFVTLCNIIRMPEQLSSDAHNADTAERDFKDILKLNTSLSNSKWRARFAKQNGSGKKPDYTPENGKTDNLLQTRWPDWLKAEDGTSENRQISEVLKSAGLENAEESTKSQYHALLQPIAEEAAQLITKLKAAAASADTATPQSVKKKLNKAIYGKEEASAALTAANDMKGKAGAATDMRTLCGVPGTDAKAETITQMLLCLCSYDGSDGERPCQNTQSATAPAASLSNAHTLALDLITKCPAAPESKLTAAQVATQVALLLNKFKSKGTNLLIGDYTGTGCTGSKGQGKCVLYKALTTADQTKFRDVPWRQALQTVFEQLQQMEVDRKQRNTVAAQIKQLKDRANNLLPQTSLYRSAPSEAAGTDKKGNNKQPAAGAQSCTEHTNKTAEECKKLGCDHDAQNKKCKAITGKDNAKEKDEASGTATATGCARHKDKTECDADKKDDKQNCAWRTGKDNEPDKEKEMCRNSSFLINNKLPLWLLLLRT
uniref:Variant surface glycoprotein 1125.159 n=1 Tax=Trypanosoma brucei TaxID=5691 RepID=M4SY02_9TRYP|nr:variant surface glycoprotein 389 [Trypanosoma brucei]APD73010.1 variant surface glycoprotein 1125.159 [Trypanosoma brucei]